MPLMLLAACAKPDLSQRTILERQGSIQGASEQSFVVEVRRGDVLLAVLEQSGLDLQLRVRNSDSRADDTFDSFTGRYGEERVQIEVEREGNVTLTVGTPRLPKVTGNFKLTVTRTGDADNADAEFTKASRADENLAAVRRIEGFANAEAKYSAAGKIRLAGLAALAAINLLNETASDSQTAVKHGERAVAAFRKVDAGLLLPAALLALASAQVEAKAVRRAITLDETKEVSLPEEEYTAEQRIFSESRALFEALGSRIGAVQTDVTRVAQNVDGLDPATRLQRALATARESALLNEVEWAAFSLMNAGVFARDTGDYHKALDLLHGALLLVDARVYPTFFANVSDNLAFMLRQIGDYDGALALHGSALAAYASFGECSGVSRTYFGLGYELLGIGDLAQALRFFKLALSRTCTSEGVRQWPPGRQIVDDVRDYCVLAAQAVDRDTDDRAIASWIAWELGNFVRSQGDATTALACHDVATTLATSRNQLLGMRLDRVRDLLELNRTADAERAYQALASSVEKSHVYYQAHAGEIRGQLLALGENTAAALQQFAAAAAAYRTVGLYDGAYSALTRRAALAARRQLRAVGEYFADADAALEDVRLLSLDPAYSASLFASGRGIYNDWISASRPAPYRMSGAPEFVALAISERSRGRLISQVARVLDVSNEARDSQMRSVAAGTLKLLEIAERGGSNPKSSEERSDPLAGVARTLGLDSTRFDAAAQRATIAQLQEFQRALGPEATVIEYMLGDQRSHAWVLRSDSIVQVELAPAKTIRAAATSARAALDNAAPIDAARLALAGLYDLVLRPLESQLRGDTLQVVLDDALFDVPFAALWDREREQYLIERTTVMQLPSLLFAQSRAGKPNAASPGTAALIIGDPVYEPSDARSRCAQGATVSSSTHAPQRLRRIPASGREALLVKEKFSIAARAVTYLTGCEATRARVLDSGLAGFRYLHFATHATADAVVPQRSAIYLSAFDEHGSATDGVLTAGDLLGLHLNAELIVLSGCSTAGGRQYAGEGALGLSFSALATGSRKVLSTLWPVSDAASVTAMNRLYAELVTHRRPVAKALQIAQLEMLASERWNHPRNWAAYALLGS
jgi:CHAT domain-containing protein/tetratricopeptide (TPR) repeat protein